jgi:hypothetical protein
MRATCPAHLILIDLICLISSFILYIMGKEVCPIFNLRQN